MTSPEDYEVTVNPFPLHVTFSEEVMELDESFILVRYCQFLSRRHRTVESFHSSVNLPRSTSWKCLR